MPAIVKYLQFWLYLLYCSYLGLTPSPNQGLIEAFSDKVLHGGGYLLLIVSCNIAYLPNRQLLLKIALLLGFSTAIEIAQHFIPRRGFSLGDLLANLAGLLLGAVLIVLFSRATNPKLRQQP